VRRPSRVNPDSERRARMAFRVTHLLSRPLASTPVMGLPESLALPVI